ncbi:probable serine/threonine protein kinase IREH1 isoform X1 [Selaginella moellendorffii]|uniref:probable serine/threonine protein kinase IREH1 isoform X1 n=1 Tax=Selaginella moellendorffii TaxID=88036 RepID=UPI000D1C5B0A|nr:probable serine/threonine protein kinase IREH1 isoform X1 [Selaginella moellendorffii]|eukprot:XP_024517080.1 probable serine/threonine protein kinase IREH1 isoform X1 [Selaginella moellendorffii]
MGPVGRTSITKKEKKNGSGSGGKNKVVPDDEVPRTKELSDLPEQSRSSLRNEEEKDGSGITEDDTVFGRINREKKAHSGGLSEYSTKQGSLFSDFDNLGASSLGLNRIKTRSGPLSDNHNSERNWNMAGFDERFVQEKSFAKQAEAGKGSKKQKNVSSSGLLTTVPRDSPKLGHKVPSSSIHEVSTRSSRKESSSSVVDDLSPRSWSNFECSSSAGGRSENTPPSKQGGKSPWHVSLASGSSRNVPENENLSPSESVKETNSPRFQALLRVTSTKKGKRDIKSFSHELDPKGVRSNVFWRPHIFSDGEKDIIEALRSKFNTVKEEINTELEGFAGDLIEILEKKEDLSPDWKRKIEDLLVFAQQCAMMSSADFREHCESIVQDLDDRRQELPMGLLKQLHTRMLFILTRCTRLVQLTGLDEEMNKHTPPSKIQTPWTTGKKDKAVLKPIKEQKIFYSQELNAHRWKDKSALSHLTRPASNFNGLGSIVTERLAGWKKFGQTSPKLPGQETKLKADEGLSTSRLKPVEHPKVSEQRKKAAGDELKLVCRICEETVPASQVGDHSRVCAVADRCFKGRSIDEKLYKLAEMLEKIVESYTPKSSQTGVGLSPVLNLRKGEGSEGASPKLSELNRRGSEDMLDELHEMDAATLEDLRGFGVLNGKSRFGPKSDQGLSASSTGSRTPCSPITTPRASQIDLLLERASVGESEDIVQINELADIARCAASTDVSKEDAYDFLGTCMQDLQDLLQLCRVEGLTVHTFGKRIEKLLGEKYLLVSEGVEHDSTGTTEDDDDDGVASLQCTPHHPSFNDRTSIDDFEIIKPISRGAFGRVFLARKRTTGDLFAIKVLRKADMIRKNAVESVHAERNILIHAKNPFLVRFFYSFTCKENLYLVMEYLNGGDMYSMLRNLGCLDEDMARYYIAELVLALEYLHSLAVIHRDLKPDNILIAHDGHIRLTDFGLSKVGLINSTDDLSAPASRGAAVAVEKHDSSDSSTKKGRQQKTVGTPDYLAPEILLGTAHGYPADWWSVGVILFEFLTGIPPFNAEDPQMIFENILNRNIPWPNIPGDMSFEAADFIDKLLAEDPNHRLGAKGAAEVKAHPFFKEVEWDSVGSQQAVFIPSPEGAHDTSYFTSRHKWSSTDGRVYAEQEFPESSDYESSCDGSSSSVSSKHEEGVSRASFFLFLLSKLLIQRDECNDLAEFDSPPSNQYSFSNFSFKNLSQLVSINYDMLLQQSGKDLPKP